MNSHSNNYSIEELICNESFQQYCLGNNLSSQLYWEEWIAANSHSISDVNEAKRIIYILSGQQGNRLEQLNQLREGISQFETFKEILLPATTLNKSNSRTSPTKLIYKYIGGIAASLLLVSVLYLSINKNLIKNQTVVHSGLKVINSGIGERKTTILSDGSIITLRKNSSLSLKSGFNNTNREVWLSGEGFFDVKHDTKHPFIVHALTNDIKVLGTIFNIKAYPGSETSETSLIRGRVEVIPHNNPHQSIILKPNQKLITSVIFDETSLSGSKKPSRIVAVNSKNNVNDEIKWVRSRLDIENQPLSVIAEKLQEWYGIKIVFEDNEVKNYRYSGVFENENVIKSLEALQLSYPFNFRAEGDVISISK